MTARELVEKLQSRPDLLDRDILMESYDSADSAMGGTDDIGMVEFNERYDWPTILYPEDYVKDHPSEFSE